MHTPRPALIALAVAVLCTSGCHTVPAKPETTAPIAEVIKDTRAAIAHAETQLAGTPLPKLAEVKLNLQTVASVEDNGEVTLYVLNFGSSRKQTTSQQIELTLTPPETQIARSMSADRPNIGTALANAIVKAAEGVKDSNTGKTPLEFTGLEVVIGFTVARSTKGGVDTLELLPINLKMGRSVSDEETQTLTVTFKKPEKT